MSAHAADGDTSRRAALERIAQLETEFARGLTALQLDLGKDGTASLQAPLAELRARSERTTIELRHLLAAADADLEAGIPALADALNAAGEAAGDFRRALDPAGSRFGFAADPPLVSAGEVLDAAVELSLPGHSFGIDFGHATIELIAQVPSDALALGVEFTVEFEGRRVVRADALPPGLTILRFAVPAVTSCTKCEGTWEPLSVTVAEWRATSDWPILGR